MADTDLCSLSDVLLFRDFKDKSTDNINNQIKALITNKTKAITTYLGFEQIYAQSYTEYYDGNGDNVLFLDNIPINSVSSINIDSDWTWGSNTLIPSGSYRIANKNYIQMSGYYFTIGEQNVKIVYNAGYTTIPVDLKQVCIEEVTRSYNEKLNMGVSSRTDPKGTVTRFERGFMKQNIQILNRYKKTIAF